jgi:iron(III) transport system substrate-binding protein
VHRWILAYSAGARRAEAELGNPNPCATLLSYPDHIDRISPVTVRRRATLSLLPLLAGLLLSACGTSRDAHTITLYSGQHEQTTALLVARFEKESGIKVELRSGDEASLGNQIMQEGANSPADVFYAENSPVLESLQEHGLLSPVAPSTLAAVPAHYSSDHGDWVGVSARASALVYDPSRLGGAKLPASILELAQPRWRGKVGIAPSETDFQLLITAIIKSDGEAAAEAWLKGLQANARIYSSNEALITQINNGESAIAPIDTYYWYRLRDELGAGATHAALHFFAPGDVGELVDVSGAAVLASSSHKAAAQRLLAFLVSAAGQETIAHSHSYEYPLHPGIPAAPALPPLAGIRPAPLTPADLGDGSTALKLEQNLGLL